MTSSPKRTTKKATKKAVAKKPNGMALAIQKEKSSLQWGGNLPSVRNNEEDAQKLAQFCNQVAQVYGVPSLGVNAMGGNPYLNKDGRLYLLNELRTGKTGIKAIRKDFLQMSTAPDVPAIIKVTLVFRDGHEVEAIGEASKESVKLAAVKATLNMMAETRGLNRAIWQEIGGDVWNRVAKNLKRSQLDEEEKARIVHAGSVSFEEMDGKERPAKPVATSAEKLVEMAVKAINNSKDVEQIEKIRLDAQGSDKINVVQKKQIADVALARLEQVGIV